MWFRISTLIRKELQALLRDRQGRLLLIVPVLLQLALFPFAATLEVKNNTLGVLDEDGGPEAFELVARFSQAQAFSRVLRFRDEAELRQAIETQQALVVVRFPPGFSREVAAGRATDLQAILDGRRSNSGQVATGYLQRMLLGYVAERNAAAGQPANSEITVRHWYNPNLDFLRHIVPSLVAIITTISTLVVTALSIAREREQGTFDQLLVSPLTPGMIMVGKAVPALLVASVQATIIVAGGVFAYGIPFQGALWLLYAGMVFYILAVVGIGFLVSSVCATQQQAFLGVFSFMMPAVLLSGFPSPVENMPLWLQAIDWFNPLRHFIVVVKAVFIKGLGPALVIRSVWPLLVIGLITLAAANWMFRRRLG